MKNRKGLLVLVVSIAALSIAILMTNEQVGLAIQYASKSIEQFRNFGPKDQNNWIMEGRGILSGIVALIALIVVVIIRRQK